jgi:hypothetical protein
VIKTKDTLSTIANTNTSSKRCKISCAALLIRQRSGSEIAAINEGEFLGPDRMTEVGILYYQLLATPHRQFTEVPRAKDMRRDVYHTLSLCRSLDPDVSDSGQVIEPMDYGSACLRITYRRAERYEIERQH